MRQWLLVGKMSTTGETCSKLIDPVPFRVGRRPDAALTLPRSTVSGMHAELFTEGERLFVRDLSSTNGTFINGVQLHDTAELRKGDVIQFADISFQIAHSSLKKDSNTKTENFSDHALARVQFDKLLRDEVITPYFQPIVDMRTGATRAFEVLARSRLIGLETPGRMFVATADQKLEGKLSDLMRRKGVEASHGFNEVPTIFLNTHPVEFENDDEWDWVSRLREMSPGQKIVVEIHEGAGTDVIGVSRFRSLLRDYEIELAFDDFGVGQARIAELASIRPEYVKFDRSLISGLDLTSSTHRRFVHSLVEAIRDIGVTPLAEGIETFGEQQVCKELGFELAQGFFLGMPQPVEYYRDWNLPPQQEETSAGFRLCELSPPLLADSSDLAAASAE